MSKARDMSRDIALISCLAFEDLHPLLGEQKQHIQGRVTWSETKLMIGNQDIGEEEGLMSEAMMDSITLLMIGRRLIGL